jgi:hypothetical protein
MEFIVRLLSDPQVESRVHADPTAAPALGRPRGPAAPGDDAEMHGVALGGRAHLPSIDSQETMWMRTRLFAAPVLTCFALVACSPSDRSDSAGEAAGPSETAARLAASDTLSPHDAHRAAADPHGTHGGTTDPHARTRDRRASRETATRDTPPPLQRGTPTEARKLLHPAERLPQATRGTPAIHGSPAPLIPPRLTAATRQREPPRPSGARCSRGSSGSLSRCGPRSPDTPHRGRSCRTWAARCGRSTIDAATRRSPSREGSEPVS